MGFRESIKKGGKGFLNNVDVTFKGYRFTDRFEGETEASDKLYFVPQLHVDGADEPVSQHIFIGKNFDDNYVISKDGQELTTADESPVTIPFVMPFGRFLDSLLNAAEKAGVDIEAELPDLSSGEPLNLETLVGRRFRVKQEVDAKGNETQGKRKVKRNGKIVEYDRTNTVIEAILGTANGNGNGKSTGAKKSSGEDVDALAAQYMRDVLANGPENRKNLRIAVVKSLLKLKQKNEPVAEAVKAKMLDEEWQNEQDWLSVDKKGNLSIEE